MSTDVAFLASLRRWAQDAAGALGNRACLARDADQYQAAEVADLAATQFGLLGELLVARLDAEHRRLLDAVTRAEKDVTRRNAARNRLIADIEAGVARRTEDVIRRAAGALYCAEQDLSDARAALAAFVELAGEVTQ